ncbi:MAG: hypothetical protein K6B44_14120 [Lachnospiraceae bacterium]|nr:hypothetical protein [Lachnospiraceae bacterium]
MNGYSDIIDHPHYRSKTRKPMSMENRAAQFAPFAALSGFDESVRETERLTEQRIELEESGIAEIVMDDDTPVPISDIREVIL